MSISWEVYSHQKCVIGVHLLLQLDIHGKSLKKKDYKNIYRVIPFLKNYVPKHTHG